MEEQMQIECLVPTNTHTRYDESCFGSAVGEAWQHKVRVRYEKEESASPYWERYDLSIPKSIVKEIDYATARDVIEKYEWLGCMPACVKYCYGLFFPSKRGKGWLLGGVTVFSQEYAENMNVWDKYGYTGKIILLARGVNMHFCPKNANSHLIMESIKLLPPEYEVVTCTIDNLAGEIGTIYQSCNFVYVGVMRKCKERTACLIDGRLYGERALRKKFGTQAKDRILELYPNAKFIKQKSKERYFYFRGNKTQRKKNMRQIEPLIRPYPKRERG